MKEVTYKDWVKNPTPREMWCWNSNVEDKVPAKVIYVVKTDACIYPVLSIMKDDVGYETFRHCAEIEKQRTRRMTNQEFAWWLKEGTTREYKHRCVDVVRGFFDYPESRGSAPVNDDFLIRENGGEWHEPLVEVEE